ncbi:MAG TPA: EAL domain-containing protein [Rhabdaerophilum sp.]|nr:EAL domain-containing protein [Rhabdaerophilum sp.]
MTEAHERQVALERTKEEYRSLFENSIVGIFRSTLDGRQLRANPALVRLNGYENEEEMLSDVLDIGKQWYVDPNRRREFIDMMDQDGRVSDFVSEVYRCKTREKIWVSEAVWLVRDEEGNPAYYEGMVTDASARRAAEKKIAHIALHDMLTNLPNRTLFQESLSLAISENRRGHELALLCLDLDHFKDVNDTMGHDCGDILLRLAARRIARSLPAGGMAARFGGDEFAVLLPNIRGRDYVMHLAREIVAKLSRPFRIRGKRVFVGASIGIAIAPTDGNDAKELLKKADIALYRAKRDGRGTYSCFDEGMTAAIHARREIEQDLRRAIEREEFRLVYQPIIDLESNAPNGYEALVRWEHPTKGLLAPAHFIEVAEESGLIVQIGEIVLRQACSCIVRNHKTASVSVNLSPIQFRNHHLTASVLSALAASRLPASRLVLEITESVLLTDDTRTLEILQQLRALGVRIALDDFGIGHSSLSYLQKFPFDRIKIDKSFVQEAEDGMMNTAIRRAILGLGNDIGIEIVVEGVETEEQRNMLIYEGCRYVQGYFYGRPQPEEEVFSDSRSADAVRKAG